MPWTISLAHLRNSYVIGTSLEKANVLHLNRYVVTSNPMVLTAGTDCDLGAIRCLMQGQVAMFFKGPMSRSDIRLLI